jgi:hypothetical protein
VGRYLSKPSPRVGHPATVLSGVHWVLRFGGAIMLVRFCLSMMSVLTLALCCGCGPGAPSATATLPAVPSPVPPIEAPSLTAASVGLSVPQGKAPLIDGTLAPGEWDGALVESFADGSELMLQYREPYLYLAIRSSTPEMIVGNIFVADGDRVRILHSSAALGTAVYQEEMDAWRLVQAFDWRCRGTGDTDSAKAERALFLKDEGWLAANSRMGTANELEYQIEMPDGPVRLAANLLRSSEPDSKIPWPADLDDDCIKPTPSGAPEEMEFVPEEWVVLGW